jgi:ABC-type ATPase with predicted acetyltransferase domain
MLDERVRSSVYATVQTVVQSWFDRTSWPDRTVTVRDDLSPAQALKTEIHELGHVLHHHPEHRADGLSRERMEVEAESVACVVCDTLGVDAGECSIPYVANWVGGR